MAISIPDILTTLGTLSRRYPNHPSIETPAWSLLRLIASAGGYRYRHDFDDVHSFCLFVGHGRSGHSLIGALLDAHADVVIAHELHALDYLRRGLSKRELYYLLLARSRWFVQQHAEWTGYKYAVPSQHKGTYRTLQVIGDKKGGMTSHILLQHPDLLKRLQQLVDVPVKVIHVARHPFDNIATMAEKDFGGDIDVAIDEYFRHCEGVEVARAQIEDAHWHALTHEAIIRRTRDVLRDLCSFLDVAAPDDYLDACADVVFDSPSRSREKVTFSADHVDRIREQAGAVPFLSSYSFSQEEASSPPPS